MQPLSPTGATQSAASLAPWLPWSGVSNQRSSLLRGVPFLATSFVVPAWTGPSLEGPGFLFHPCPPTIVAIKQSLKILGILIHCLCGFVFPLHELGWYQHFVPHWSQVLPQAIHCCLKSSPLTHLTGPQTNAELALSDTVPAEVISSYLSTIPTQHPL